MNYYTIEGFEQLTKEQLLIMSVTHVLTTQEKSNTKGTCKYAGIGCAASPFLREECREEADDMAGSWEALSDIGLVPNVNSGFINEMQRAHDWARSRKGVLFVGEYMFRIGIVCAIYNISALVVSDIFGTLALKEENKA